MLKRNKMQENKRKGQPKRQKLPKGQNSEGTFPKGLIPKGQKKRGRRKEQLVKPNREKREKFFDNSRELFVCEIVKDEGSIYR